MRFRSIQKSMRLWRLLTSDFWAQQHQTLRLFQSIYLPNPPEIKNSHTNRSSHLHRHRLFASSQQDKPDSPQTAPKRDNKISNNDIEDDPHVQSLLKAHIEQLARLRGSSKVMEQTLVDTRPAWQVWLAQTVGTWLQSWIEDFMKSRVERDFDLHDWLEGAKDSYWTIHQLLAEHDFDTLKGMVSAKLLHAVRTTADEYKEAGLVWRTELNMDEGLDARINGISLWTKEEIALYDEDAAKEEPRASPSSSIRGDAGIGDQENVRSSPMYSSNPFGEAARMLSGGRDGNGGVQMTRGKWLVLTVQYNAVQEVVITRDEDATVVAKLVDKRPISWKFACGPLGDLPVDQLENPWWLLKFS